MDSKIIILIILILIILYCIFFPSKSPDVPSHNIPQKDDDQITEHINYRVRETLLKAGYKVDYRLHSTTISNFTKDKKDIYICTSCIDDDKTDLEKLTYVGLHEVAHVLCKSKDHTEEWKNIFKKLLYTAANLGYLDERKITGF